MIALSRLEFVIALVAAGCTVAATAAVEKAPMLGESVYEWTTLTAHKTPVGEVRSVLRASTPTLDELEIHVTTLDPGKEPHPPHKHPNEELIILDKGDIEVLINGQWKRIGPGSVLFNASNVLHGLRNVGVTPAQYHVINFKTDKTPRE